MANSNGHFQRHPPEGETNVQSTVQERYCQMWEADQLTDYTLHASDGVLFRAHKSFLAANSDYFFAMFTTSQALTTQKDCVHLVGICGESLKVVLYHIYGRQFNLNSENIASVLDAAAYLQVASLVAECTKVLKETLSPDTFFHNLKLIKMYSLTEALPKMDQYFFAMFEQIMDDVLINDVDGDDWERWAQSDNLSCGEEFLLYKKIVQWLDNNPQENAEEEEGSTERSSRWQHWAEKLLSHIRFPLMETSELGIAKRGLTDNNLNGILERVKEAIRWHSLPVHLQVISQPVTMKCRNRPCLLTLSQPEQQGQDALYEINILNEEKAYWVHQGLAEIPCRDMAITVINNFVVACGGSLLDEYDEVVNTCYILHPLTLLWTQLANMNVARMNFPLVTYSQHLLAVSGSTTYHPPHNNTRSVEKYSFTENRWCHLCNLPVGLERHSACVSEQFLYISGGVKDSHAFTNQLVRIDCETGDSTMLESMATTQTDHSMHVVGRCIYIIRGSFTSEISLIDYYSMDTDQWNWLTLDKALPGNQAFVACRGDEIYMVGGAQDPDYLIPDREDLNGKINLQTKIWRRLPEFPKLPTELPFMLNATFVTLPKKFTELRGDIDP